MRASVAICTHNRADYLAAAIRSVAGQGHEVLVVDNASTDSTAAVVASEPGVRYVHEAVLGLSHARNRALQEASGDVVAFLDDDAVACENWLQQHLDAYADASVGGAGGRIDLSWPAGHRPRWMPHALDGLYAGLNLGPVDFDMNTRWPYGANMSVRREAALALGGFDPALGRKGTSLISNEESKFFDQLHQTHRIRYLPTASVEHAVVPGRDRFRYVLRRSFAAGRSQVIAGAEPRRVDVVRSLAKNGARIAALRGGGERGPRAAVVGAAWAAEDLGRLFSVRRASAKPRGSS